jgi:signal transduction histidine kinase
MNIRKTLTVSRLRRPPLRVQLTVLYSGLFAALVAAVLGVSGLLLRSSSRAAPLQDGSAVSPVASDGRQFEVWPAIVGLIAVLIALWLAWWIAGRFLRPLRQINTTAQEISATNLHRRLALDGPPDELSELGRTLDDLFGRLEASFESQRHFVANASHELRTPLAGQRTLLQVALADPDASAADLRATCEEALVLGEQQEHLIDALLTLATSERGVERWESFDLGEVTDNVLAGRRQEAELRGIHIHASIVAAPAFGDPRLVESLVANLVDNAIRHNLAGGIIEIGTISGPGGATVSVNNTGPLVPPGEIERLLQPFQQAGLERVRHSDGHGLGLAIVRAIARAHGATLSAHPRSGGGLEIQVTFVASRT